MAAVTGVRTLIRNVRAVGGPRPVDEAAPGWLLLAGDAAEAAGEGEPGDVTADRTIDARGGFATPGFVDIHTHGGGGHSNEGGADEILAAAAAHRTRGTTRSVVSLVCAPVDALERNLRIIAGLAREHDHILGSHLEGPFLAEARCGAHDTAFMIDPTPDVVERLIEAADGTLRQITLDPRRPGSLDAIRRLRAAGVAVAVGHTEASYEEASAAFDAGATLLTHAFNAMPGLNHRAPGPVLAAVDRSDVVLELILDGMHVDERLAARLFQMAPGRIALVTDAMDAAVGEDGAYVLGGLDVDVHEGRAVIAGTDTLAGSTLDQATALRIAIGAGIAPDAAVAALTSTPARALGEAAPALEMGAAAPGGVLVFDADWSLREVVA
ncbi:N-acetylglucosamine-6-phosphate deacetylase [Microbacterium halophytorum]|uniref:N-acetylglucosamine-6-phosphate deacetylase n=1 Tax=Microbacterium halophytorum TaxID=2067568 RepID=UPI000CFE2AEF|nr:amidohydrolase family protein [Microbacterium halophytorum]